MKVNFDVEFFYGENEQLLLNTKLNSLNVPEIETFKEILNNYLDSPAWVVGSWPSHRYISEIAIVEETATLTLRNSDNVTISSNMSFQEILVKLSEDYENFWKKTLNDIQCEELPTLIKELNYSIHDEEKITEISLDGCDDAIVRLKNGKSFDICSETTAQDILDIVTERV